LNDRALGLLAIAGGVSIIAGTLGFREVPGQPIGSAFFPRIVGAAAIVAGIAQIAAGTGGPPATPPDWMRGRGALRALAVVGAVVGWLLLAGPLGFLPTTALVVAGLALALGARALPAAAVGVAAAAALHVIFASLLRVPLPRGPVEALLS
jgi:putative tricarboxylic transport membrane protein